MSIQALQALAQADRERLTDQIVLAGSIKGSEGWIEFTEPVQVQITGAGFTSEGVDRLFSYFYVLPVSASLAYRDDLKDTQIVMVGYLYMFDGPEQATPALNRWSLLDGRRHLDEPVPGV